MVPIPASLLGFRHPANFHFTPWLSWARLPFQAVGFPLVRLAEAGTDAGQCDGIF
jgi:hypothetical protein